MRIFNESDIQRIKARAAAHPEFLAKILKTNEGVLRKLYIQKTGVSTWNHYYVCPKHSVKLIMNYDDPKHYVCPIDGEVFTGEPYEGGWWMDITYMTATACYELALAEMIDGGHGYGDVAKRILLGYAENYKNYEVHGGIPYNNPGRFGSQVLNDSTILCDLSRGYDLLYADFSVEERELIENELFRPAAKHQMDYLTDQIHNHEVHVASSIALVGLAIGDGELMEFALNRKYGLKYQIDHGFLEDGFWFECSLGYHLYALSGLMDFESAAKNSEYSLFADGHYREKLLRALRYPRNLLSADGMAVALNDGGGSLSGRSRVFEHAYAYTGDEVIGQLLSLSLREDKRDGCDALVYGAEEVPELREIKPYNYYSAGGSQIATIHGEDGRNLLFKATPFGGEHDHYDRLGVHFTAFGKNVSRDLGTAAGYSAPLHYAYFKNTATHNTVVIDGENMAPCATRVTKFEEIAPDEIYLSAVTQTPESYEMLDSFTIKQWSEESYRGAVMERHIGWFGDYFVDIFKVRSEGGERTEWVWHTDGVTEIPEGAERLACLSEQGAQSKMTDVWRIAGGGIKKTVYDLTGDALDIYSLTDGMDIIYAKGPDNPSVKDISYLLLRTGEREACFVSVIEAHRAGASVIADVRMSVTDGVASVEVTDIHGKVRKFEA